MHTIRLVQWFANHWQERKKWKKNVIINASGSGRRGWDGVRVHIGSHWAERVGRAPPGGVWVGVWFSSWLYYPFGKGPGQHIIRCPKNKKCENDHCMCRYTLTTLPTHAPPLLLFYSPSIMFSLSGCDQRGGPFPFRCAIAQAGWESPRHSFLFHTSHPTTSLKQKCGVSFIWLTALRFKLTLCTPQLLVYNNMAALGHEFASSWRVRRTGVYFSVVHSHFRWHLIFLFSWRAYILW